jgi:hypothetical protein
LAEIVDAALTWTTIKSKSPEETVPETTIEAGKSPHRVDRGRRNIARKQASCA